MINNTSYLKTSATEVTCERFVTSVFSAMSDQIWRLTECFSTDDTLMRFFTWKKWIQALNLMNWYSVKIEFHIFFLESRMYMKKILNLFAGVYPQIWSFISKNIQVTNLSHVISVSKFIRLRRHLSQNINFYFVIIGVVQNSQYFMHYPKESITFLTFFFLG